ncbi:MAG: hypothetical protein ACK2UY_14940, partial [Anaerolineae bacterium]
MEADQRDKQAEPTWAQRLAERTQAVAGSEPAAAELSAEAGAPAAPPAGGDEPPPGRRRRGAARIRLAGLGTGVRTALRNPATRRRLRSGGSLLLAFLLGALAFGAITLSLGPDSGLGRLLSGAAIGGEGPVAEVLPGLALAVAANPDPASAGSLVEYTLRLTNTGGVSLSLTVLNLLPAGTNGHAGAGALRWTPVLGPGAVWRQSFAIDVPPDYQGLLTDVVWATTLQGVSGAYTLTIPVADTPRLALGQQARPDPVQAGGRLTYTLRLTNTGNVTLQAAIADVPPPQVAAGGPLTWSAGLPPGGTWSRRLPVTVELGYAGLLVNRVEVTTDQGASGASTHTAAARVSPRLSLAQRVSADPVAAGSALTYTLSLTNTGNLALRAVVTDRLPAHVRPRTVLTWRTDLLPPGAAWSRTVAVSVGAEYAGVLTNVVQAAAGEGPRAVVTDTVLSLAPRLEVAQQARPRVRAGQPLTFALAVTNTGNVPLHATIWDHLPARAVSGDPALWWTPVVGPQGVWTQTVALTTAAGYTGPLTNVVQVTSAEGATGICTATVQVRDSQLDVFSAAVPDPVWAGSTLTYTLAVTNAGNVLLHATIETALPEQVTPTVPVAWAPLVLEPGDAWTVTVPVEVAPHYGGVLTNVLSVETVEKVSGAYTTTVLSLAPAVTLTQWTESTSADALAGEPLTYTLQVINEGNVDLHAIILDLVPEHVTPTQGLLWWMTTITAPGGIWEGTA